MCIFGLSKVHAQDFYWENPKTFVNAESVFPLVAKNSNESYVFWEEVESKKKEISISLRKYENLNSFYDNRTFSGVIKYSGNEIPDIYSAAVLENGYNSLNFSPSSLSAAIKIESLALGIPKPLFAKTRPTTTP